MSEKTLVNLIKASDKAVKGRLQHLIAIVTPDGRIQLNGSANMVKAVNEDIDILNKLKGAMLGNVLGKEDEIVPSQILDYPLLPCSPFSSNWQRQGSIKARSILSTMMSRAGYGRCGTKQQLGVGEPPYGWPQGISWKKYSGATRSGLTFNEVTEIIVSLLQAADIDPDTHIVTSVVNQEDGSDQNNSLAAAVDLVYDDREILDHEDNIAATGTSVDHNAEPSEIMQFEKEVFGDIIDEGNNTVCDDPLIDSPSQNVVMVQIKMQVLEDIIHHEGLDANIEVVEVDSVDEEEKSFHNEEDDDGSVQEDLNGNVGDDVNKGESSSGLQLKKRRHGYD